MDEKASVEYAKAALEGSGLVAMSVLGSTLTTCVVFIPLTTFKRHEWTDVYPARLDDRILYECIPALRGHGRSVDVHVI